MTQKTFHVLVIGATGNFASRLVKSLLNYPHIKVIMAARNTQKCRVLQTSLLTQTLLDKPPSIVQLDINCKQLRQKIGEIHCDCVVNACGPYQSQNYAIAQACIDLHKHYIDFADARDYVCGIQKLDQAAKNAGVCIISGASTVPGLSSAVIDAYLPQFDRLEEINYGISLANKTEPGLATLQAILSYLGKSFTQLYNGRWQQHYGWQHLQHFDFAPPLGKRWFCACNIADSQLLPKHYPNLKSVKFNAGLELPLLHFGLSFAGFICRCLKIRKPQKIAPLLIKLNKLFRNFGSENSGMYISLYGKDQHAEPIQQTWQLLAQNGDGANIPTIAAEIIINKLASQQHHLTSGAYPCISLFTLAEFLAIAKRWQITELRK